jgi:arginase
MAAAATAILVMRNSLGQNYSRGVELTRTDLARILPKKTPYTLIPSTVFRASAPDGAVSTVALAECERMLRSTNGLGHNHSVFVGGDHLTSMCTVLASLKVHGNNFRLIWLDAHADIHSPETSPSNNSHGMVVNMLINHTYAGIPRLLPNQILYVGLRSTEPAEDEFIRRWKIRTITAREFLKNEMSGMRRIAAFAKGANVHVSLDIDVLDPSVMRATATPAPSGLHLDQLMRILGTVESAAGNYYATDIMEYNPKKCADAGSVAAGERDAAVSIQTMRTIFGFLTGR